MLSKHLFNRSRALEKPFSTNLFVECHVQAAWVGRAEGFIVHSLKSLGLGVRFVEKPLYGCAVWDVLVDGLFLYARPSSSWVISSWGNPLFQGGGRLRTFSPGVSSGGLVRAA